MILILMIGAAAGMAFLIRNRSYYNNFCLCRVVVGLMVHTIISPWPMRDVTDNDIYRKCRKQILFRTINVCYFVGVNKQNN